MKREEILNQIEGLIVKLIESEESSGTDDKSDGFLFGCIRCQDDIPDMTADEKLQKLHEAALVVIDDEDETDYGQVLVNAFLQMRAAQLANFREYGKWLTGLPVSPWQMKQMDRTEAYTLNLFRTAMALARAAAECSDTEPENTDSGTFRVIPRNAHKEEHKSVKYPPNCAVGGGKEQTAENRRRRIPCEAVEEYKCALRNIGNTAHRALAFVTRAQILEDVTGAEDRELQEPFEDALSTLIREFSYLVQLNKRYMD